MGKRDKEAVDYKIVDLESSKTLNCDAPATVAGKEQLLSVSKSKMRVGEICMSPVKAMKRILSLSPRKQHSTKKMCFVKDLALNMHDFTT
jgi:hypothetical protein